MQTRNNRGGSGRALEHEVIGQEHPEQKEAVPEARKENEEEAVPEARKESGEEAEQAEEEVKEEFQEEKRPCRTFLNLNMSRPDTSHMMSFLQRHT